MLNIVCLDAGAFSEDGREKREELLGCVCGPADEKHLLNNVIFICKHTLRVCDCVCDYVCVFAVKCVRVRGYVCHASKHLTLGACLNEMERN